MGIAVSSADKGGEARPVPLAEFVSGLREELREAQAARDPGLQFAVGPAQLLLNAVKHVEENAPFHL